MPLFESEARRIGLRRKRKSRMASSTAAESETKNTETDLSRRPWLQRPKTPISSGHLFCLGENRGKSGEKRKDLKRTNGKKHRLG
jgi:hypothetical protein